jgi:hypothetical protein
LLSSHFPSPADTDTNLFLSICTKHLASSWGLFAELRN